MRKLCLTLATGVAVLSAGALSSPAGATTLSTAGGLRAAVQETAVVDQVRLVCTHFWNGRWHRFEQCFWSGGHRHGHRRFR
jgi:hypothetical protein